MTPEPRRKSEPRGRGVHSRFRVRVLGFRGLEVSVWGFRVEGLGVSGLGLVSRKPDESMRCPETQASWLHLLSEDDDDARVRLNMMKTVMNMMLNGEPDVSP